MSTGEVTSRKVPNPEDVREQQALLLDHAAERLLEMGRRAGITPDQIAAMLNSGMNLDELVRHLMLRLHG